MNGSVVIDASDAVKWVVNEIRTNRALTLARSWVRSSIQPMAPYLMPVEVSNALYRRVVLGEIPFLAATELLDAFLRMGIELREPTGVHRRAMELSSRLSQDSIYDTQYLALAETLDCELWTADDRFYRDASPSFRVIRWLGEFEEGR